MGILTEIGGSLNETMKSLAKKIGIEDDNYQVIQLEKKSWYSDSFGTSSIFKGQIKHQLVLYPDLDPKLMNQFLYLYKP